MIGFVPEGAIARYFDVPGSRTLNGPYRTRVPLIGLIVGIDNYGCGSIRLYPTDVEVNLVLPRVDPGDAHPVQIYRTARFFGDPRLWRI